MFNDNYQKQNLDKDFCYIMGPTGPTGPRGSYDRIDVYGKRYSKKTKLLCSKLRLKL